MLMPEGFEKHRPPDWDVWRLVEDVRLWEAVALSLNIEPRKVQHSRNSWMHGRAVFLEREEFEKRLFAASRSADLPRITLPSDPSLATVSLSEFAKWSRSIGWSIPDELAERTTESSLPKLGPNRAEEEERLWPLYDEKDEIEEQIAKWERIAANDVEQLVTKEQRLAALREDLYRVENLIRQDPPDDPAPRVGTTVVLPADKLRLTVEEIPALIAEALYPVAGDAQPMTVSYLAKTLNAVSSSRATPLTEEDWAVLHGVWRDLPPYREGMNESEWHKYERAFDAVEGQCDWRPTPMWRNPAMENPMMRVSAEEEHERALRSAIASGELVTRNHALVPFPPAQGAISIATISRDEFEQYVARFGMGVSTPLVPDYFEHYPGGTTSTDLADGDVVAERENAATEESDAFPKPRSNILTPLIKEAMAAASDESTAAVWVTLCELARRGKLPFTGEEEPKALWYTDDKRNVRKFKKEDLRKRLSRLRQRTAKDRKRTSDAR